MVPAMARAPDALKAIVTVCSAEDRYTTTLHYTGGAMLTAAMRAKTRTDQAAARYWATLVRSSAIGCWLGITPGGAIAASFMGYNLAKRFAKDK